MKTPLALFKASRLGLFLAFFGVVFLVLFQWISVKSYHVPEHDCISVSTIHDTSASGTIGTDEANPDAGRLLFSATNLRDKGQDGSSDDEVYDDGSTPPFVDKYPNVTPSTPAYRTCIDTEPRNDVSSLELYKWYFYLRGWTYSDNLGWVSFNCKDWDIVSGAGDVCSATNDPSLDLTDPLSGGYKTYIDGLGYLHGWAWSTTAGWIQFDWNISSCGSYVSDLTRSDSCTRDEYYYAKSGSAAISIPQGRVYDNLDGRDDCWPEETLSWDASGNPVCGSGSGNSGANPAGDISEDGIGRFYGYAWNPTVGWFDFTNAWGVEDSNSFCVAPYPGEQEGCGELWRPGTTQIVVKIVNSAGEEPYVSAFNSTKGSIVASGVDEYKVQVQFLDRNLQPISSSNIQNIIIDDTDFLLGKENTLQKNQTAVSSSDYDVKVLYLDSSNSCTQSTYQRNYDVQLDNITFTIACIRSIVPTSFMNGIDYEPNDTVDIFYDGSSSGSEKYRYGLEGVKIEAVNFVTGYYSAIPIVEQKGYISGFSEGNPAYLKFQPAVEVTGLQQKLASSGVDEWVYYISTARDQDTRFQVGVRKNYGVEIKDSGTEISNIDLELDLGVAEMQDWTDTDGDGVPDGYTDSANFHFVFNTDTDGIFEYASDKNFVNWKYTLTDFTEGIDASEDDKWDTFLTTPSPVASQIEIFAMPVLKPGGSADERIKDAHLESQISYEIDGATISLLGHSLNGGTSEAVYNPSVDIESGLVSVRGLKDIQDTGSSGDDMISIGSIKTRVAKEVLLKNLRNLTSGKTVLDGSGWVSNNGIEGVQAGAGTVGDHTFSHELGEVYYFKNGNVVIQHNDGASDPVAAASDSNKWYNVSFTDTTTIVVEGGNILLTGNVYGDKPVGLIAFSASDGTGGNIYIAPQVTNIRAALFADNAIARFDGNLPNGVSDYSALSSMTGLCTTEPGSGVDWNGDGKDNTQYCVPSSFQCSGGGEADLATISRNQLFVKGLLSSLANTLGGSQAKNASTGAREPFLGTGDTFVNLTDDAERVAIQHDFNSFSSFKLSMERNSRGYPKDQSCGYYFYGSQYYDVNGLLITDGSDASCDGIDETKAYDSSDPLSGDLVLDATSWKCDAKSAQADLSGTAYLSTPREWNPFIVSYEEPSVQPLFSGAVDDSSFQRLVPR